MIWKIKSSVNKHLHTVTGAGIGKLAERVSYNALPPIINVYIDKFAKTLEYLLRDDGFP